MINLLALTEEGLNANTAVELRKAGAELGIKGASKGKKADLIAAIMELVESAKAEAELEAEAQAAQEALQQAEKEAAKARRSRKCTECGRKEDFRASGLCKACREYGEWENAHSDEGHEELADSNDVAELDETKDCPVCRPELDRRTPLGQGRGRAGMVIVAKGTEIHKSRTFKEAAEAKGWKVEIIDTFEGTEGEDPRYVAVATRPTNLDREERIELSWNGRAYDYPNSSAFLNGRSRKVRNLKEALRLI